MLISEAQRAKAEIRILILTLMKMGARSMNEFLGSQNVDINGMQFGILRMVSHRQVTLSDLSKLFVLDPSTLVPLVDTLERKGLIQRERDPNDRRRVPLYLTDAGAAMLKRIAGHYENDVFGRGLEQMGEGKTQQLLNLLRELVHNVPDGDTILDNIHEQLKLPVSERCPQRIPDDHV